MTYNILLNSLLKLMVRMDDGIVSNCLTFHCLLSSTELEEKLLAAVTEAELMRNRADTLERRTLAAESYCKIQIKCN